MPLVVDASVLVKWVLREAGSPKILNLLETYDDLLAPELIWSELASVLWKCQRRGHYDEAETTAMMRELLDLPVRSRAIRDLASDILGYALILGQSTYDCTYLAVAEAEGCRLVTADRRFWQAVSPTPFSEVVLLLQELP